MPVYGISLVPMRNLFLISFLVINLFSLSIKSVYAHPLDEIGDVRTYDQKQILEVSPTDSKLTIALTFYTLDKNKVWESIDKNRDQKLSIEEKDTWMKLGSEASWLEKNGIRYNLDATTLTFPEYFDFFSAKPADVLIVFKSNLKASAGDKIIYHYKGKDKSLTEINFEVKGTNNLKVSDINKEAQDSIGFNMEQGQQDSIQTLGLNASSRLNKFLSTYVKVEKIPVSLALTALVVAFLIGMLHALTPGHGKAIVAGYLVGEKGTIWHAVQLGLIITITHTSSVFILGLAALFLTQYIVPATVIKWMNLISGFLVTGFGAYLVIVRLKALFTRKSETLLTEEADVMNIKSHSHDDHHHHEHSYEHDHAHSHGEDHPPASAKAQLLRAGHHHHEEIPLTWKNLLPLGISGGIVPCIDALAILIVAISLGKIMFGITLLILFSLGLASALIIGGAAVVIAKNKALSKISAVNKYQKYVSLLSAIVVTILGIAIILNKPI